MSVTFQLISDAELRPSLTVPYLHCTKSRLLMDMLSSDAEDDNVILPLTNIKDSVMVNVVEFMAITFRDKDDPICIPIQAIGNRTLQDVLPAALYDFITPFKLIDIMELAQAANFLDYTNLLNFCLTYLACLIKDKDFKTIHEILEMGKEADLETEAKAREEHGWWLFHNPEDPNPPVKPQQ